MVEMMLQISTLKVLGLLNFLGFATIVLVCELLTKGTTREKVLGGICVGFSVIVFAAPLSIMVRTYYVYFKACERVMIYIYLYL